MSLASHPDDWSCTACGYPLDYRTQPGAFGQPVPVERFHPQLAPQDHDPLPENTPASKGLHCDLCTEPNPGWRIPVKNVERWIVGAPLPGPRSDPGARWAACGTCAALTDARDLDGLIDRALVSQECVVDLGRDKQTAWLRQHFQQFQQFQHFLATVLGPAQQV